METKKTNVNFSRTLGIKVVLMGGRNLGREKRLWFELGITSLLIIMTIISYRYYRKFEDAKYAYNRNCYYRTESIAIKTERMIEELQKIIEHDKISKEDILKLKFLESAISTEITYLNFQVGDYQWKISKVNNFNPGLGIQGMVIDAYFNYIEKSYTDGGYIDVKKEADALNHILLYYTDMKKVIYNDADNANFEQNFKADILRKDSWIQIVSRLNKFEQNFNDENRDKILENLK